MNVLVITAVISNGGDFLIEKRLLDLIAGRSSMKSFVHRRSSEYLDSSFINKFDVVITGAGPAYNDRLIENNNSGFFHILNDIKIPIHFLGAGVYGDCGLDSYVSQQRFSSATLEALNKIIENGGSLGCRDNITAKILKNNGLSKLFVTGCPVWYDEEYLDNTSINKKVDLSIKKIAISDPGVTKNQEEQVIRANQTIDVIKTVNNLFPDAQLIFTFNNGINTKYSNKCNNIIKDYLVNQQIPFEDLSYSADKFDLYDDVDLHIGYRVHSHIYCLSHRIPSILIEEDIRGYGVNDTLKLPHIYSYDKELILNGQYKPNASLNQEIEKVISHHIQQNFENFHEAFDITYKTFHQNLEEWFQYVEKSVLE